MSFAEYDTWMFLARAILPIVFFWISLTRHLTWVIPGTTLLLVHLVLVLVTFFGGFRDDGWYQEKWLKLAGFTCLPYNKLVERPQRYVEVDHSEELRAQLNDTRLRLCAVTEERDNLLLKPAQGQKVHAPFFAYQGRRQQQASSPTEREQNLLAAVKKLQEENDALRDSRWKNEVRQQNQELLAEVKSLKEDKQRLAAQAFGPREPPIPSLLQQAEFERDQAVAALNRREAEVKKAEELIARVLLRNGSSMGDMLRCMQQMQQQEHNQIDEEKVTAMVGRPLTAAGGFSLPGPSSTGVVNMGCAAPRAPMPPVGQQTLPSVFAPSGPFTNNFGNLAPSAAPAQLPFPSLPQAQVPHPQAQLPLPSLAFPPAPTGPTVPFTGQWMNGAPAPAAANNQAAHSAVFPPAGMPSQAPAPAPASGIQVRRPAPAGQSQASVVPAPAGNQPSLGQLMSANINRAKGNNNAAPAPAATGNASFSALIDSIAKSPVPRPSQAGQQQPSAAAPTTANNIPGPVSSASAATVHMQTVTPNHNRDCMDTAEELGGAPRKYRQEGPFPPTSNNGTAPPRRVVSGGPGPSIIKMAPVSNAGEQVGLITGSFPAHEYDPQTLRCEPFNPSDEADSLKKFDEWSQIHGMVHFLETLRAGRTKMWAHRGITEDKFFALCDLITELEHAFRANLYWKPQFVVNPFSNFTTLIAGFRREMVWYRSQDLNGVDGPCGRLARKLERLEEQMRKNGWIPPVQQAPEQAVSAVTRARREIASRRAKMVRK